MKKGEKSDFTVVEPDKHYFNRVFRIIINSDVMSLHFCYDVVKWHFISEVFLPKHTAQDKHQKNPS